MRKLQKHRCAWTFAAVVATVGILLATCTLPLYGGIGLIRSAAVGGISIDAQGVVSAPKVAIQRKLQFLRQKKLKEIPRDLAQPTQLRKISLRQLEETIHKYRTTQFMPLPDDLTFLGGLQRVQYIFVYPERNDIVLAGPAEGWRIDELGNAVGQSTGRPVLLLDDLLVALRSARDAAHSGITCSIDPTADGMRRLSVLANQLKTIGNPERTMGLIEEALGPQTVTVTGVAPDTHFARVMVAADFRMKRLAMGFVPAPIPKMPSFLQMAKAGRRGMQNMLPRWWLAPDYEPLLTDPEGLSWEIRGQGVQCLTMEDFVNRDGTREGSGKAGLVAQKWADNMTAQFEALADKDSTFAQLRNIFDLAIVAALIEKESLLDRAGIELPYLMQEEMLTPYNSPKQVNSQASFVQKSGKWLISASGGVEIYPRQVADQLKVSDTFVPLRDQLDGGGDWWWD